jgi:hypothetical protein
MTRFVDLPGIAKIDINIVLLKGFSRRKSGIDDDIEKGIIDQSGSDFSELADPKGIHVIWLKEKWGAFKRLFHHILAQILPHRHLAENHDNKQAVSHLLLLLKKEPRFVQKEAKRIPNDGTF